MAKEIIMPKFGFTMEESTIVQWLVQEGAVVEQGDPICEVTTDKINMEVEAPADGIIAGIRYQAGDVVPVTDIIAWVIQEGEQVPDMPAPSKIPASTAEPAAPAPVPAANAAPASSNNVAATPIARRMAEAEGVDLSQVAGSGPEGKITREDVERYLQDQSAAGGKVRATPAARRVAREHSLDLAMITGTGPRGRVQEVDALAAAANKTRPAAAGTMAAAPMVSIVPSGEPQIIPLEGMRRTIAQRLQASYQQAPHILFTIDINMSKANEFRKYANERVPEGQLRISMTAIIVKATAWALRRYPIVNSYLMDDRIMIMPDVNVGMAVALEDGLIVPVIHHADQKGLMQIGSEVVDLSERARTGHLRPQEVADGTFTISNLGMYGIDQFTSIINPPQVGILSVGRIAKRFVPGEHDEPLALPLMTVTLAVDHRVIDGAVGANFLTAVRDALEEPASVLL